MRFAIELENIQFNYAVLLADTAIIISEEFVKLLLLTMCKIIRPVKFSTCGHINYFFCLFF